MITAPSFAPLLLNNGSTLLHRPITCFLEITLIEEDKASRLFASSLRSKLNIHKKYLSSEETTNLQISLESTVSLSNVSILSFR